MPHRRHLLRSLSLLLLAGCTGDGSGAGGADSTPTATPAERSTVAASGGSTGTPTTRSAGPSTGTPTATDGAIDLREANVVGAAVDGDGGRWAFDVTLHHDDDGEPGYADWWQVERLDGTRVGRRELRHPHGTREFTRSDTYSIPDDVDCVVVRGHDRTHGYGGRAAVVRLSTGAVRFVDQGAEPRPVDADDCPRPTG